MLETYKHVKYFIPSLELNINGIYAEIKIHNSIIFTVNGGNIENTITIYLLGLLTGFNEGKKSRIK